jgi:hypothetical protein
LIWISIRFRIREVEAVMASHRFLAPSFAALSALTLVSAARAQDDRTLAKPPEQPVAPAQPFAVQSAPSEATPQNAATIEVPSGTKIRIRMIDPVDSGLNHAGQLFRASLDESLRFNDAEVIPAGAEVTLRLIAATQAEPGGSAPELRLKLVKIVVHGQPCTLVAEEFSTKGTSRGKMIGEAAAIGGVLLGGVGAAAGGADGAIAGGAVGAGAGATIGSAIKQKQVSIPSETKLEFTLEMPLKISAQPKESPAQHF